VLLGLLTVATFQTTKDLEDHIGQEASSLSTMYHSAENYPEPLRSQLRADLRDYTHYVIEKDWRSHRRGETPKGGEHRLEAIRDTLYAFEPQSKTQEVLHDEIIRQFNTLNMAREQRLGILGGLLTIMFLWMIHVDLVPQIFLGGITPIFLGIMTFLIYAMDHPLQGAVSVGPEPFQSVFDLVMKWDEPS
jgi:hypothetical protein